MDCVYWSLLSTTITGSTSINAFVEDLLVTNNTVLAWHSPSGLWKIFGYGFKCSLGIHGFRPTWPSLIVEVLGTPVKFLQPYVYRTVINCTFTFWATNVNSWLILDTLSIISQIKLRSTRWSNVSALTTTILPNHSRYRSRLLLLIIHPAN